MVLELEGKSHRIALTYTATRFGGRRPWFSCPHCQSARRVLYLGHRGFACRSCLDLRYASQIEDEISRCIVLVRRAMYDAWQQPGAADAGPRPALLDIRLDSSGRVVSYRIRQSSGSPYFDQTVLKAAANAAPIRGLTPAFLKRYETLTVEFKLE